MPTPGCEGATLRGRARSQFVIPLRYALGISTFIIPPGTMEERLPIFDRLRSVTSGQMYFLSLGIVAAVPGLDRAGFEVVDRIPLDFVYQRIDQDPARLDGWLLPYRTTRLHVYDMILHKVPRQAVPATAPTQ
jgi:hypothetical protein